MKDLHSEASRGTRYTDTVWQAWNGPENKAGPQRRMIPAWLGSWHVQRSQYCGCIELQVFRERERRKERERAWCIVGGTRTHCTRAHSYTHEHTTQTHRHRHRDTDTETQAHTHTNEYAILSWLVCTYRPRKGSWRFWVWVMQVLRDKASISRGWPLILFSKDPISNLRNKNINVSHIWRYISR